MSDQRPDAPARGVRRGGQADADALRTLLAGDWPEFEADLRHTAEDLLGHADHSVFLALEADGVCGCVLLTPGEDILLNMHYVAPSHRRRSHGRDLIRAALDWAQIHHPGKLIFTLVGVDDRSQRTRFERFGFRARGVAWRRSEHTVLVYAPDARTQAPTLPPSRRGE